jgi:hypothetical protein
MRPARLTGLLAGIVVARYVCTFDSFQVRQPEKKLAKSGSLRLFKNVGILNDAPYVKGLTAIN